MYRCSNLQIQRFNFKIEAITGGWENITYLWEGAAPFQVTLLPNHSCSKMMRSGTSSARRMLREAPPFKIFFNGLNALSFGLIRFVNALNGFFWCFFCQYSWALFDKSLGLGRISKESGLVIPED